MKSACHLIVKCLAEEEIPNFEGFIRPLNIIVPEGTIVNPLPPAACAARAIVGWRSLDLLLGCFAQIVPDRVPAAGEGGVTFPSFSGYDGDDRFVCTEAWQDAGERCVTATARSAYPTPVATSPINRSKWSRPCSRWK